MKVNKFKTADGVQHELTFNPDSKARYTIDGKRAPGMTTLLGVIAKPQLQSWAVRTDVRKALLLAKDGVPDGLIKVLESKEKFTTKEWDKVCADYPMVEEATNAHAAMSDKSKDSGTLAHGWLESYVLAHMKGKTIPLPEDEATRIIVEPVLNWIQGKCQVTPMEKRTKWNHNVIEIAPTNIKFLATEQSVCSVKYWYSGTFDVVCEIDGERYILDWKTSSGVYGREYFYQMAGYRNALQEMQWDTAQKPIKGSIIVRSGKEGDDLEVRVSEAYEQDFNCVKAALVIYRDGFVDFDYETNTN